ncbi:substrate-binding domain-containing protein [Vreelandella janggokensis]|jgi:simple sugar transport system substrate-binding protein|uniref:Substrate-binding domain-containing protein n=1 Tax=Vreelandella janggokensis TaxID=370767 RepID=A0ABT4IPY7_9GAMM|nr:substrate-binding domain-containing protein [Halomonas janggokensis]MCZ0925737.1 substrate-binding domain-containing protein [Halomonas janggokensis]MDR5886761.1 substrate-binding domain-containing protein [Halomonas janggokensis]
MNLSKLSRRAFKLAATTTIMALASGAAIADESPTIGVVAKIGGIPWFNAMENGIEEKAEELGVDGFMVGPTSADPALQVRAIEDMIAQGVDVIGVVPNDAQVLEPVLARAREQGIIVLTHESPDQQNVDWNFELASAQGFGEAYGERLAELMDGSGQYAVFVGGLSVPLHNAWADAAIAYIEDNHPDMSVVGDRYGVAEDVDASRRTALDLMRANEDLGGILAFGSQGPIGAARAVAERRLSGEVVVLGPFSPGQGRRLLHDGVLSGGFMWNPKQAGEVFVTLGTLLANGETLESGMEVEGLGVIDPDVESRNIIVDQLIEINSETVDELAALGL